MMRIIFERSGGILGVKSSLTIELDKIPADQAVTLQRLLDEAHFFTLPENPPVRPVPDGFQYMISVESDATKHTVRTTDSSAPDELRPLLQELSLMARRRPKA
jgi:hypothetical protein